jgi:hypothetical protein
MARVDIPALAKIRQIAASRDLSTNEVERQLGLPTGGGSRLLSGQRRASAELILLVRNWSDGVVQLEDWIEPAHLESYVHRTTSACPAVAA